MANQPKQLFFAPNVVLQVIGAEALILKLQDESVFALNATGTRVAQLIADGQTTDALIDSLSKEYGKSRKEVASEVSDLVDVLLSKGLVIAKPEAIE